MSKYKYININIFIFIMAAKHTDGNIRQKISFIISLECQGWQ